MLKKMRNMLRNEEGFTLMELMIVVVIIGILAAIAVPVYRGLNEKAEEAVGKTNAAMLNRGVAQLLSYGELMGVVFDEVDFDGSKPAHITSLFDFLGLDENDGVQHVKWESNKFIASPGDEVPDPEDD